MKERLDKILASQNIGSRKDVGLLIRKGAITVNGLVVKKSDTKVDGDLDEFVSTVFRCNLNAIYIL